MAKITAVILSGNIYLPSDDKEGPDNVKFVRGDQVEIDRDLGEKIVEDDKKAGRDARLSLILPKRKKKNETE